MPTRRASPPTLDLDAATRHLRAADPAMDRLIAAVGPCRLEIDGGGTTFAALTRSIVYQQLHGRAAATIHGRICVAAGGRAGRAPSAAAIARLPDEVLRGAGLSQSKLLALRDLAARAQDGRLPSMAQLQRMDDDAIIASLVAVRGIGRWSAQMLMMFRLGRPDILPVDDFGVRKGFGVMKRAREMPTRDQLARHGRRWAPWRTVASWYLWRACELPAPPPRTR